MDEAQGVTLAPYGKGVYRFRASAARLRTFQVRATPKADPRAFKCIEIQVEPGAGAGETKKGHAGKRREVLAGTGPEEHAEAGIRNDLDLEFPAARTTLVHPGKVAVAPDGRILVADQLGLLAIHRDRTLRRIAPPGILPVELAVGPDNLACFTAADGGADVICRLESDGTVTRLNRRVPPEDIPETRPRLAASTCGIKIYGQIRVLPGGAILISDRFRLTLMGPARSDASLAKRVQDGVHAALHGPWARAQQIRDGLRQRAEQDPGVRDRLQTVSKDVGKDLPKVLPQPLVRLIGKTEGTADPAGLAFRAWVALYVLDREIRDHSPEKADKLGAFPRRSRAVHAAGAGAAGPAPAATESKN